jgi:hypothetical protein
MYLKGICQFVEIYLNGVKLWMYVSLTIAYSYVTKDVPYFFYVGVLMKLCSTLGC